MSHFSHKVVQGSTVGSLHDRILERMQAEISALDQELEQAKPFIPSHSNHLNGLHDGSLNATGRRPRRRMRTADTEL